MNETPTAGTPNPLVASSPTEVVVGPGLDPGIPQNIVNTTTMVGVTARHPMQAWVDKLDPSHVTALIENEEKESKRNHQSSILRMVFLLVILVIVVAALIVLIWLLKDNPDLLKYVITGLLSFVGGIGTGLGAPKAWSAIKQ